MKRVGLADFVKNGAESKSEIALNDGSEFVFIKSTDDLLDIISPKVPESVESTESAQVAQSQASPKPQNTEDKTTQCTDE